MRSMTAENARRIAEAYLTMLRDLGPDAARVTDKMPPHLHVDRADPPDIPEGAHHPLQAQSDRHLPVDLRDLFHPAHGVRGRSRRRGVLLPAIQAADGALAKGAAARGV
jgi:hypothetical protein